MGALALSHLLAANVAPASPAATAEPKSLAQRIDLTRITVLQADYARAAQQRNAGDLAAYERELVAMLRDEVLPYARGADAPPGAGQGGTGGGTAAPRHGAAGAPAVAVDEEEVAAAALEAKVVDLSRKFMSLAGKTDDASLATNSLWIAAGRSGAGTVRNPPATPSAVARRAEGQAEERDRERVEGTPVK
jgi:hypothetical protein